MTTSVALTAANGMLTIQLHESLYRGLKSATGLELRQLGEDEANRLRDWADNVCDNPQGQRAALARMVANGVELCGELQVASKTAPRGFWESVAQ